MRTRMRRVALAVSCAAAMLVVGAAMLAPVLAGAATHDDGCHVYADPPIYLYGKIHYAARTWCKHNEFALTQYIGNEYFRHPHDDQPAWSGSAKRTCGPKAPVRRCSVSSKGPYKGPGLYCTVAMTDMWFVNRIEYRNCTTMG